MKMQRNSNLILCYALIILSFLCILGTIFAAAYLKNGIIERVRDTPDISGLGDFSKLQSLDRQIKSKEQSIEFEKQMPKTIDWEKSKQNLQKKLGIKSNKTIEVNNNSANTEDVKTAKIKQLEDEKAKLIEERNDFEGKMQAKQMKPLSWGEWFSKYSLLIFPIIPLGIFGLSLLRLIFGKLPQNNPLSLTDFERRCVLFLPFSIVFSAFGFFLFVWVLDLIY